MADKLILVWTLENPHSQAVLAERFHAHLLREVWFSFCSAWLVLYICEMVQAISSLSLGSHFQFEKII